MQNESEPSTQQKYFCKDVSYSLLAARKTDIMNTNVALQT